MHDGHSVINKLVVQNKKYKNPISICFLACQENFQYNR